MSNQICYWLLITERSNGHTPEHKCSHKDLYGSGRRGRVLPGVLLITKCTRSNSDGFWPAQSCLDALHGCCNCLQNECCQDRVCILFPSTVEWHTRTVLYAEHTVVKGHTSRENSFHINSVFFSAKFPRSSNDLDSCGESFMLTVSCHYWVLLLLMPGCHDNPLASIRFQSHCAAVTSYMILATGLHKSRMLSITT